MSERDLLLLILGAGALALAALRARSSSTEIIPSAEPLRAPARVTFREGEESTQ